MGHHSQAATVGCAKCQEFHAYDDAPTARSKLRKLRDRDVDHSHEGLAVVWKDWSDLM